MLKGKSSYDQLSPNSVERKLKILRPTFFSRGRTVQIISLKISKTIVGFSFDFTKYIETPRVNYARLPMRATLKSEYL